MDLKNHLTRQMAWSKATFGPTTRMNGVLEHMEKEIQEVRDSGGAANEWVDLVILALDGLTRQLSFCNDPNVRTRSAAAIAETACYMIAAKQDRNENRTWPDWRKGSPDRAIEHDRSGE